MLITEKHGVVLVDTKNPGWGPSITDAVKAVTEEPITTIINTHGHNDHVGSNAHFPNITRIISHENARDSLAKSPVNQEGGHFLPTETFQEKLAIFDGRDQIDLHHFGSAHTDGDTIVVFPALKTAHVGDLFARKAAPYIDRNNGGSGLAYPETLSAAIAALTDIARVIPGHAPPPKGSPMQEWLTWDDFRTHSNFTHDLVSGIKSAHAAQKSVDEALATFMLQDKYPEYDLTDVRSVTEILYDELNN
tara:strand:+ start:3995 stop:4738 length:744 start_codon:yes stop_codon:yes gene_type:complete